MNENKIYGRQEAIEYLGLTLPNFRYHVYVSKNLVPDGRIGRNLIFTKETLDAFKNRQPKTTEQLAN